MARGKKGTVSNPFCTRFVRPGAMTFRFHESRWGDESDESSLLVDRLIAQRFGLVIGPHGSGKSTLLRTLTPVLRDRFPAVVEVQTHSCSGSQLHQQLRHYRHNASAVLRQQSRLQPEGLLIVDGMEQIDFLHRARVLRIAKRNRQFVLGTSHRPMRPFAPIFETSLTATLVDRLTGSLLANAPEPVRERVFAELQNRDLTGLSNLRELWFALYDIAAEVSGNEASPPHRQAPSGSSAAKTTVP